MRTYYYLFILFFVAASIQGGETYTLDDAEYEITTTPAASKAFIKGPYYSLILGVDDCQTADVYRWCVNSINYSKVDFFDADEMINRYYKIDFTVTRVCDSSDVDCVAYGEACQNDSQCNGFCVHSVCRPEKIWCGDSFCDEGETCEVDCPVEPEVLVNDSIVMNESSDDDYVNITDVNESVDNFSVNISKETNISESINDSNTTNKSLVPSVDDIKAKLPPPKDEPNIAGAVITLVIGLLLLVIVIYRGYKNRKKRHMNLDSQ